MATTSTIGTTGRDYSTLQAWEDAVPATPTDGYIGECYNDSEFTGDCIIAGHTTSAANYITLTAATGQSFQDHANKRTNPLYYDATKGVGIHAGNDSGGTIQIENDYVTVSRLQVKRTAAYYGGNLLTITGNGFANCLVKDCIFLKDFTGGTDATLIVNVRSNKIVNCLVINKGANAFSGIGVRNHYGSNPANVINCSVINVAASYGTGVVSSYSSSNLNNTAVFGFAAANSGTFGGNYNATNFTAIQGANSKTSLTTANQFESETVDFRVKAAADLIASASTDETNAPNDITATDRAATTGSTIGAWEYVGGGGGGPSITEEDGLWINIVNP